MFRVDANKYCSSRNLKIANLQSLQKGLRGQLQMLKIASSPAWRSAGGFLWSTRANPGALKAGSER